MYTDHLPRMSCELFRKIFRLATRQEHPSFNYIPADLHRIWCTITPETGSICPAPTPVRETAFTLNSVGRVISVLSRDTRKSSVYVMVALRRGSTRLAPHVGSQPPELAEYLHPQYLTTDGTLGPYDPTHYAQSFHSNAPWIGFHRFPRSGSIEAQNPINFYKWEGIDTEDLSGGTWNLDEIKRLLEFRAKAEESLQEALRRFNDPSGDQLKEHWGPQLPFFDELSMEVVRLWRRWDDGRDAVGACMRYISELGALRRWLAEVQRQARDPSTSSPLNEEYAGVWIGGISTNDEWNFLANSPLPLYGLFTIPPSHALYTTAKPGYLDNDEYYRFDAFHDMLNTHLPPSEKIPTPYDEHYDFGTFSFSVPSIASPRRSRIEGSIPPNLRLIPPTPSLLQNDRYRYTESYTTYLYIDAAIQRNRHILHPDPKLKAVHARTYHFAAVTASPFRRGVSESDRG